MVWRLWVCVCDRLRYRNKHSNQITISLFLCWGYNVSHLYVVLDFQTHHKRFHCIHHLNIVCVFFVSIIIRWASHISKCSSHHHHSIKLIWTVQKTNQMIESVKQFTIETIHFVVDFLCVFAGWMEEGER